MGPIAQAKAPSWIEERYRTLVETVPHGIEEIDTSGIITFANSALHRQYDYDDGELIGISILDLVATDSEREELRDYLKYLVAERPAPTPYFGKKRTRQGRLRDVQVDWTYKRDTQGQVTGFISVITDITERRRAEDALRRSESRYRDLVERSLGLICTHDLDGKLLSLNPAAAQSLGYGPDELVGRNLADVLAPAVRAQLPHYLERLRRDGSATGLMRAYSKDGQERLWAYSNVVNWDEEREPYVIGHARDGTEEKRAERALRQAREELERRVAERTKQLEETNVSFRRLIETTNVIPWEASADTWQFTYVGPQAVKILGYPVEQWFERDFWPAHIHPDDREDAIGLCLRSSRTKDQYEFEYRMVSSDGRIVWMSDLVSVIRENGKPRTLQGFMIDITKRKRAELLQAGHNRVLEMVAQGKILQEVLDELACVIENQHDQEVLCSILLLDAKKGVLRHGAGPNLPEEYYRAIDGIAIGPRAGSCGTAAYRKKRIIVTDTLQDPLWKDFRELAQRFSLRACWSEPILSGLGQVLGTFGVYHRRAYRPSDDEISLIEKAAPLAAVAIEHARAQDRLRDLGGRLIRSQEDERRRVARELHDDFNQRLSLLSIELEQASERLPESPALMRELMQDLSKRTKEISTDVHRLSHRLHPSKLEHLGLVAAVKSFCRELSKQEGTRIEFTHREVPTSIPKDVALCIYRTVQEALRNVVKHSAAGEARAKLTGGRDAIRLQVSDPGVGFEPASVNGGEGLGLVSMRERLRLVGGEISIQSQPSRGTRIDVRVPLSATEH